MRTAATKSPSRRRTPDRRRSREAERLERTYSELGFAPRKNLPRDNAARGDFVFTPPSFLPYVPYTVSTLAGV